jgi:hypothetical protein
LNRAVGHHWAILRHGNHCRDVRRAAQLPATPDHDPLGRGYLAWVIGAARSYCENNNFTAALAIVDMLS